MSLLGYQNALAELIASPELCRAARRDPDAALGCYDLTPLERRRLAEAVHHPGMVVNCTLYRANRVGPIYARLANTCFGLGHRLREEMDRFWAEHPKPGFQVGPELHRFAGYLRRRIGEGAVDVPFLEAVLEYELAVYDVSVLPRRPVLEELRRAAPAPEGARPRLHPLVRVVEFRHEPAELLRLLSARVPPPYELEEGEFYLQVDRLAETRVVTRLPAELGRALRRVDAGDADLSAADVEALVASGRVVLGP